jgi:hypothetical protein
MDTDLIDVNEQLPDASTPVHGCRVTYSYQQAEGVIRDLSRTGCGIRGDILPPIGTHIRLTVYLEDEEPPLSLDATVTWKVGEFFGVDFERMDAKDYTRIRRYMWTVLNQPRNQ